MEEYFKQGEKEKELGLPCSPLCDRDNTLVAESQIGKKNNFEIYSSVKKMFILEVLFNI
jgi:hypothetical protein